MKVLVVEDEKDLNSVISRHLKKSGYAVDSVFDGSEALDFIASARYDAIVLDVMMPIMNGHEFLQKFRAKKISTPVLILTAKDDIDDIVSGLDMGADDYLVKPFDFRELLARVRTLIRRSNAVTSSVILIDDIAIDTAKKAIVKDGAQIELTAKEYEILELLAQNRGKILSREQISQSVWDFNYTGGSNVIDVLIKNIRKKLENSEIIETKRGLGYVIKG